MQFGVPKRIVLEKHHAFAALLELQQAQKIKKQLCWNSSKPKNQKDGLLELQQAQKIKKQPCWNSSKPKNQKDGLLELQQA